MPLLKGIKVNLISQWECKIHPEFPHPEGSQASFNQMDVGETVEVSAMEDGDPTVALTDQITASVYIPSCSGARFWIRWSIDEPAAEDAPWYFFKLLMNGRQITSWGTNALEKPEGHVMRGLFEPSDRWNYKNEGTIYKNMGTEARPFLFAEEGFGQSVAIDGGLIEVQVFRAFGRKRRLAEPTNFRTQEPYGIIMPSGGLLERPQDAKFYDWHLKDPRDSPFIRFKFHYRSWDSLQASELIPENHRRTLLSPTPSVMKTLGLAEQLGFEFDVSSSGCDDDDNSNGEADEPNWEGISEVDVESAHDEFNSSDGPWLTGVFDNSPPLLKSKSPEQRSSTGLQYGAAPIRSDPVKPSGSHSKHEHETANFPPVWPRVMYYSREERKFVPDRPLPKIPQPKAQQPKIPQRSSSNNRTHSRLSSISSFVTPSLRSYVEKSRSSSFEAETGVARAVDVINPDKAKLVCIPSRKLESRFAAAERTPPDTSFENSVVSVDYKKLLTVPAEFTPPTRTSSATHKPKPLNDSPHGDFFSQPNIANITVRKHKRSPGLLSRLSISGNSFRSGSPFKSATLKEETQFENDTPIISKSPISEGEWMCRTPSPVKNTKAARYENIWSPSPGADGKKMHAENGKAMNGSPIPIANGGMLHKMKKGVGNGIKGILSGSPTSSILGEKKSRLVDHRASKSFTENPTSSANGGDIGEKRLSDKERLRRKGMEWVGHVKHYRGFSASMDEPNVRTGQMSSSTAPQAEGVEEPKWI